jgi:hypothetical protein
MSLKVTKNPDGSAIGKDKHGKIREHIASDKAREVPTVGPAMLNLTKGKQLRSDTTVPDPSPEISYSDMHTKVMGKRVTSKKDGTHSTVGPAMLNLTKGKQLRSDATIPDPSVIPSSL